RTEAAIVTGLGNNEIKKIKELVAWFRQNDELVAISRRAYIEGRMNQEVYDNCMSYYFAERISTNKRYINNYTTYETLQTKADEAYLQRRNADTTEWKRRQDEAQKLRERILSRRLYQKINDSMCAMYGANWLE
ncbi:MAG: hypothetical protein MJ124_08125, partial [Lachnospiraceae bacterium]|nr:hypothetical protein [Lachnospiraceae bacterium]